MRLSHGLGFRGLGLGGPIVGSLHDCRSILGSQDLCTLPNLGSVPLVEPSGLMFLLHFQVI